MSDTDLQLLARYSRDRADDAFAEIVRRHLDLVHSAALRQVRSPQLAEEVAQSVFTDLARIAGKLKPDTVLTAWLYQVTRHTAVDVIRRESRRQFRERIATEMNTMNATTADWTQIEPLLDEAMDALDVTDRAAVLLRYFENKSLREVGQTLGTSDDAAQKRVSRAVERLREFFAKRGVTIGASGLVVVISANAVQAAPVGLAVTISTAAALAGTTLATTATVTAVKAITMTTLQKSIIGATLAAAVGMGIYEARVASTLRTQVQAVQQQQADQNRQLEQERGEAAAKLASLQNEIDRLNRNTGELLRLRAEVSRMKKEVAAAERSNKDKPHVTGSQPNGEQAVTNSPPVESFSASARSTVEWNQALVAGGWKMPSGKRTVVFAVPKRGDDASQLTIETRIAELPEEAVNQLGLGQLVTEDKDAKSTVILTSEQYDILWRTASALEGVDLLSAPRVTTLSGHQAQIQTTDVKRTPLGENYSVGPVIDILPTISADGQSVDLGIVANINYPSPRATQ